jgi:DNA-binding XRE family transcriptional regulator
MKERLFTESATVTSGEAIIYSLRLRIAVGCARPDRSTIFVYTLAFAPASTIIVDIMTPAQCRAARSLLGMTQSQLADTAVLGLSTVVDFEKERRRVSEEAVERIRLALENAGIEFLFGNGGGVGLRLRRLQPSKRK